MLQQKIASPLSRKATLVSVVVSQWTARKLDRRVTDEVNRSHGAAEDAGRYNKLLVEANRLEEITGLVSQIRKLHYTMTKPWCDEGLRILPNVLHEKFAAEYRTLERKFNRAVDAFCRDFSKFVEERKVALNGLFNEDDYPTPENIRSKFKLAIRHFPIPEASDFRCDVLDEDTIADIKRELTETSETVLQDAMKDTFEQITTVVGHMAEKLKGYTNKGGKVQNIFRDSLVENVRQLADLLPAFNLTNDPALDQIAKRIKTELCVEDAKTLRENSKTRKVVQKSADDILKDVSALLG